MLHWRKISQHYEFTAADNKKILNLEFVGQRQPIKHGHKHPKTARNWRGKTKEGDGSENHSIKGATCQKW